jgi:hypothetical protein
MPLHEPISLHPTEEVSFDYTNWRGKRERRRVRVIRFCYGSNEWHTEPTMFMYAYDLSRRVYRYFAVVEIDAATICKA